MEGQTGSQEKVVGDGERSQQMKTVCLNLNVLESFFQIWFHIRMETNWLLTQAKDQRPFIPVNLLARNVLLPVIFKYLKKNTLDTINKCFALTGRHRRRHSVFVCLTPAEQHKKDEQWRDVNKKAENDLRVCPNRRASL